ncbi:MAG: GNAT family N-acetyltransferase [Desulfocurvibacter africanus]
MFEVNVIEDLEGVSALAHEWGNLVGESVVDQVYGAPWVFSRPEWHLPWMEARASSCRPMVATARTEGRLAGLLPMSRTRGRSVDFFSTYLEPMTGYCADYQVPILAKGRESALEPMLDALFERAAGQVLVWRNLPLTHPAAQTVQRYIAERGWPMVAEESVCPYLRLPDSYARAEELWSAKLRQDIRRRRRQLDGRLSLEVIERRQDVSGWLEELFATHRKKWHAESQPSEFANLSHQKYYRSMARSLWGKGLHLSSLCIDGRRVSYHLGFLSAGWLYYYKTAYHKEYSHMSPTKLHVSMLMELGCASGWQGFDFLQGDEPYKLSWTKQHIRCLNLVAGVGGGGLKFSWHAHWRGQAKATLGSTVNTLKRMRQRRVA